MNDSWNSKDERRMKMKPLLLVLLSLTLVFFGACTQPSTQSSTNTAPQSATAGGQSATTSTETLKIGIITNFNDGPGVEIIRTIELMADIDNQAGGLAIGGKHYIKEGKPVVLDTIGIDEGMTYIPKMLQAAPPAMPPGPPPGTP